MADVLFRTLVRFFDTWIERAIVLATLFSAGCSTSFGAGVHAYEHGHYPEALEALASAEPAASRDNDVEGVRYALYRGLTHLALGDLPASIFWLDRVKRALDAHPALLPSSEVGRFASAWAHLPVEPTNLDEHREPCLSTLR